jgi:hypothetical protein
MMYAKGEPGEETISSEIPVEEFKQGFKIVLKKTSSSPSS